MCLLNAVSYLALFFDPVCQYEPFLWGLRLFTLLLKSINLLLSFFAFLLLISLCFPCLTAHPVWCVHSFKLLNLVGFPVSVYNLLEISWGFWFCSYAFLTMFCITKCLYFCISFGWVLQDILVWIEKCFLFRAWNTPLQSLLTFTVCVEKSTEILLS